MNLKSQCWQAIHFFRRPLSEMSGIGPQTVLGLERLKIKIVRDLFWHRPVGLRSYPLLSLAEGQRAAKATFLLKIHVVKRSANALRIFAEEDAPSPFGLQIIFFKGPLKQLKNIFLPQTMWYFSGEISLFDGLFSMVHPVRWCPAKKGPPPLEEVVYPLTKGLRTTTLQWVIARLLREAPPVPEWLPREVLQQKNWPCFLEALLRLHQIKSEQQLLPDNLTRTRLAFDELFAYQLSLLLARHRRQQDRAVALEGTGELEKLFLQRVGFELTSSQTTVLEDIYGDLGRTTPMARLLQGDVGSGKTIVAFLALARTLESGFQGVFLAPTEVLAHQQAEKMALLLKGTGFRVVLLTRTTARKAKILEEITSGEIAIVVGTHALLEQGVQFLKLGLVVIDEQHRFGVEQRLKLTQKGDSPHVLAMSATPIPRTLEMTFFGDLEVSTLREKPQGRSPIETRVLSQNRLDELETFIERHLQEGDQVYWVCPLIEDAEEEGKNTTSLSSVAQRFEHLQTLFLEKVAFLHGKQKSSEKQAILDAFRTGAIRILVSTTVIEVGVDIPEATIMVVDGAQRFGLAQLHQLRGRVGRGARKSYCFLLYQHPISEMGRKRLEVLRQSGDGFWIAEQDWRLRGGGDLMGVRQSGLPEFAFADLEHHFLLLDAARRLAGDVLRQDPGLETDHGLTLRLLLNLFRRGESLTPLKAA